MMSIWSSRIVDPGLMMSLEQANLIAYCFLCAFWWYFLPRPSLVDFGWLLSCGVFFLVRFQLVVSTRLVSKLTLSRVQLDKLILTQSAEQQQIL